MIWCTELRRVDAAEYDPTLAQDGNMWVDVGVLWFVKAGKTWCRALIVEQKTELASVMQAAMTSTAIALRLCAKQDPAYEPLYTQVLAQTGVLVPDHGLVPLDMPTRDGLDKRYGRDDPKVDAAG